MYSVAQINLTLHTYHTYMIYIPGKKTYQNLHNANHHSTRLQGICFQIPPVSHRPCSTHILPASLRRRILLAATASDSPAAWGLDSPKPKRSQQRCVCFFFSCGGAWKHVYKSHICIGTHTLHSTMYKYIPISNLHTYIGSQTSWQPQHVLSNQVDPRFAPKWPCFSHNFCMGNLNEHEWTLDAYHV